MFNLFKNNLSQISEMLFLKLLLTGINRTNSISKTLDTIGLKMLMSVVNGLERMIDKEALNKTGITEHEVIYKDDLLSILHYSPLKEKMIKIGDKTLVVKDRTYRVPLVFIPPLLAPGFAFDLYPERSLARFFLAKGFDVYLVDFGEPDKSHSHLSFEDYILRWMAAAMATIRRDSGSEELSLYGYCMGGLFSLLYTSAHEDDKIKNIVTIASPIDMHQMGAAGKVLSVVGLPAHKIARRLNISLKDIDPKYLHLPGFLGTIGFNLTNPAGVIKSQLDLLLNLWDRDYVVAHESLSHWINNLLDYPGNTLQDIIVQMGLANKLAREGSMNIGSKEAKLKSINCSMLSFAGKTDQIVPIVSAQKILDVVSSQDKKFSVVPGGHVGVIIGNQAPEHLWETSSGWLAERSN
ncbi:MAG: alpha/beta fold hydrolase [Desulfobacterales bacterium]|nr:alpha/beta fold hydrolase [Desulfobacterales bacterium]MBF0395998.1 alpha/beta fold hydrolase [Desulfobacterales bacterium]